MAAMEPDNFPDIDTRTASVASLKRLPWQVGHETAMSGRYWTSRST